MSTSLPGITFEAAPRPLDVALPRMDVAAFVGLASSGPVSMPVACEDVGRFREVFGPDLVLGRDDESGQVATSHLGPAVEAFFAAGGQRCMVVRVARTEANADHEAGTEEGAEEIVHVAQRARVALPGVVVAGDPGTGPWALATLRARAVGGWADGLAVSLGVDREPRSGTIDLTDQPDAGRLAGSWVLPGVTDLAAGDLLEVRVDGWSVFAPVTEVLAPTDPVPEGVTRSPGLPTAVLGPARRRWYERPAAPGEVGEVSLVGDEDDALDLSLAREDIDGGDGNGSGEDPDDASAPPTTFRLAGDDADRLRSGDLLELTTGDGPLLAPVSRGPDGLRAGPLWRPVAEPDDLPAGPATTARVSLRLRLLAGDEQLARLDGAGLEPDHPLGLPSLPLDEVRFEDPDAPASPFPLVGAPAGTPRPFPAPGVRPRKSGPAMTPLLVTPPRSWTDPVPLVWDTEETGLAREGLLPLTPELFADERFRDAGVHRLRSVAEQHRVEGARDVGGVHALLSRRQVTLAAVPDAVHLGWTRAGSDATVLVPAPDLASPVREGDRLVLTWEPVPGATAHRVEVLRGDGTDVVVSSHEVAGDADTTTVDLPEGCGLGAEVRVRALVDGEHGRTVGPASATRLANVLAGDFESCTDPVIALHLDHEGPTESGVRLVWQDPTVTLQEDDTVHPPRAYELAVGASVDLVDARVRRVPVTGAATSVASMPPTSASSPPTTPTDVTVAADGENGSGITVTAVVARSDDPIHARVRVAATPTTPAGPWSRVVSVPPPARDRLVLDRDRVEDGLRTVHRALLMVAAARGDVLAALSLPSDARAGDAAATLVRLAVTDAGGPDPATRPLDMLDDDAVVARRHGVVHHPWVIGPDGRPHPPDGAVCGLLADVAIRHGPWTAPANRPLAGVVGVHSEVDETSVLAAAGVNPLVTTIPGTVAVTSRTLGIDDDLDRVGPRRLLMLLRRLAEREGAYRVFAPDGPDMRAGLTATFTRALTDLFVRGALAGASPSEAFELVIGGGGPADPPGRVVVELRVAPARPMEFVTVRLIGRAGRLAEVAA